MKILAEKPSAYSVAYKDSTEVYYIALLGTEDHSAAGIIAAVKNLHEASSIVLNALSEPVWADTVGCCVCFDVDTLGKDGAFLSYSEIQGFWQRVAACEAAHPAALSFLRDSQRRMLDLYMGSNEGFALFENDNQFNHCATLELAKVSDDALRVLADYFISWHTSYMSDIYDHVDLIRKRPLDTTAEYCLGRFLASDENQAMWNYGKDIYRLVAAHEPFENTATYRHMIAAIATQKLSQCPDDIAAAADAHSALEFLCVSDDKPRCFGAFTFMFTHDERDIRYERLLTCAKQDLWVALVALKGS